MASRCLKSSLVMFWPLTLPTGARYGTPPPDSRRAARAKATSVGRTGGGSRLDQVIDDREVAGRLTLPGGLADDGGRPDDGRLPSHRFVGEGGDRIGHRAGVTR